MLKKRKFESEFALGRRTQRVEYLEVEATSAVSKVTFTKYSSMVQ